MVLLPPKVLFVGVLKFNVDAAIRGKHDSVGIGGVFHNDEVEVLLFFFQVYWC